MERRKLLAGVLAASLVGTLCPAGVLPGPAASAAPAEITLDKTVCSNPIGGYDADGNLMYGGDPAVLVDGDTVYLYTGHDTAKTEAYEILEWMCYSTKDLKNWNYEGVVMKADKASITWANTGTDAWAGQVAKYGDKYYFYYCTWDATAAGKQSIGVATSDKATGPFTDIGEPLVKGTVTMPETSGWNDIDPTVWIEKDSKGVEHRYLAWGNGKYYVCELNEDMVSVKDQNGDGKITSGTSTADADIIEGSGLSDYTEAPWLYRRSDEKGNYYGPYYLFYAYKWREEMAYATTDDLMSGKWSWNPGGQLMPPAATSNTNHMAVFDFKGKTYFVYHNGSLPGGSGFRRNACITEIQFNEDGSITEIPETAVGISGTTSRIYAMNGGSLSHENFVNSSGDGDYPYTNVRVGTNLSDDPKDAEWAIVAGKADKAKAAYVSIQSENKPGLYLTVNDDKSVTLAQDADQAKIAETAKKQTFRTVEGLADKEGVSFESVSQPGNYLTLGIGSFTVTDGSDAKAATFYINRDAEQQERMSARLEAAKLDEAEVSKDKTEYEMIVDDSEDNYLLITRAKADAGKSLKVSIGTSVLLDTASAQPTVSSETVSAADQETVVVKLGKEVLAANSKASTKDASKKAVTVKIEGDASVSGKLYTRKAYSTVNSLAELKVNDEAVAANGTAYEITVPYTENNVQLALKMADTGYMTVNGTIVPEEDKITLPLAGQKNVFTISVFAQDFETKQDYTLTVTRDYAGMKAEGLAYAFDFENQMQGASFVSKAAVPAPLAGAEASYVDGKYGKAIYLDGTCGLELCDANALGDSYTLSFWMKPDAVNGAVDPTLAAGTFSPEYWLNLTFDAKIWSKQTDYVATGAANAYKAGEWQNVTLVVDGQAAGSIANTVTGKLFVNGNLVSSGDVVNGIMTNAGAKVYFGVNAWDAYFKGALDDVMLFNQALSDDQVGAIAGGIINVSNAGTSSMQQGGKTDSSEEQGGKEDSSKEKSAVKKVVITKKGSSKAVKTLNLKKKKSVKLAAKVTVTGNASKKVVWTTSNKKLATVSAKGVVKAKNKKGTVKITAASKKNAKKKCTVTIKIK